MPTKKPVVQTVLDQDIFDKLIKICEKEERSTSNKCKQIIKEYVIKYELEYGTLDETIGELYTPVGEYTISKGEVCSTRKIHTMNVTPMMSDIKKEIDTNFAKKLLEKYENETIKTE